jgi:hypothetical protein
VQGDDSLDEVRIRWLVEEREAAREFVVKKREEKRSQLKLLASKGADFAASKAGSALKLPEVKLSTIVSK